MSGYDFSQEAANELLERADKRNDELLSEVERLRAAAQSVCDVADAWDVEDRGMVLVSDVLTMLLPLRPN